MPSSSICVVTMATFHFLWLNSVPLYFHYTHTHMHIAGSYDSSIFILFIFFWSLHAVCGILFSQPGIEPGTLCFGSMKSSQLAHQGSLLFLIFWRCFKKVSIRTEPIYIVTNRKDFFFPTSPTLLFLVSDSSHSNRYEMTTHCGFDLHSLED